MAASIPHFNTLPSFSLSTRLRSPPSPSQFSFPSTSPPSHTIKFHNPLSPLTSSKNSTSSMLSSVMLYSNTPLLCKASSNVCNVQVVADDDEDDESFIQRFRREVARARIIPEIKRRRYRETNQEKRKRKRLEAALRYGNSGRRAFLARQRMEEEREQEEEKEKEDMLMDEEDDAQENWEEGDFEVPY